MTATAETRRDDKGNEYELRAIDCPICGRDDTRLLGLRGGEHHRYGRGFESPIHRCRGCGLIYPNPMPVPKNPSEIYGDPEGYFSQHDMDRTQSESDRLVLEIIRRTGMERPAVLDIGSGRGEVVAAAEKLGCTGVGLELSEPMVEDARDRLGVTVERATVEEFAASHPAGSFDAAVASAVIEHVYDPDSFMRATAQLLRPGGVMFLDTPREPSLMTWAATASERVRGRRTVYYLSPTWEPFHLFGFNPRSIGALLGKHGFAIDELNVRSWPMVPAREGDRADAARAFIGRQLIKMGNLTRSAPNMDLWAHLEPQPRAAADSASR